MQDPFKEGTPTICSFLCALFNKEQRQYFSTPPPLSVPSISFLVPVPARVSERNLRAPEDGRIEALAKIVVDPLILKRKQEKRNESGVSVSP